MSKLPAVSVTMVVLTSLAAESHAVVAQVDGDVSGAAPGQILVRAPTADTPGRLAHRDDGTIGYLGSISLLTETERRSLAGAARAQLEVRRFVAWVTYGRVDVELVSIERLGAQWVVGGIQVIEGVPVDDTHATVAVNANGVRFADLRLVEPQNVDAEPTLKSATAEVNALHAMRDETTSVHLRGVTRAVIASTQDGALRLAWRVEVDTRGPAAWWALLVDAHDGSVLHRRRLSSHTVEGVVRFRVEPICQGLGSEIVGMPHVKWSSAAFARDDGTFADDSDPASASVELESPYFRLRNCEGSASCSGPLMTPQTFSLSPGAFNEIEITDGPLDQVDPFYHLHEVRAWVRGRVESQSSQTDWTEQLVDVSVNINDGCNAYYDGTLNFFRETSGCINSGRVAGIVYHEYGHGVHDHSAGSFDGQVSEGVGDFIAATIINDPQMKGIPTCSSVIRTTQNSYTYCNSGCDLGPSSPVHSAGQAYSGAWWDLRRLMTDRYGYDLGVATTDRIFLAALNLVGPMSSAYDAAIAADDDADGDPSNGTVHSCEINRAFANDEPGVQPRFPDLVGQVPGLPSVIFDHDAPGYVELADGESPTLEIRVTRDPGCAEDAGQLGEVTLQYRSDRGAEAAAVMEKVGVDGDVETFAVTLEQATAPVTLEYYVLVELGGTVFAYPYQGNATRDVRWPYYRQMVRFARDETLYSSDFEGDDGGLIPGGTDSHSDWEWGEPGGIGGDPTEAVSGTRIWGTDLAIGGDGLYDFGLTSYAELPPIDAREFGELRLQYWRRLLNADEVKIEVNGHEVFESHATSFYWRDPVWTFQDIDISRWAAGESEVRIRFVMNDRYNRRDDPSTMTPELGGWNIDDVRVAGTRGPSGESDADDGLGVRHGNRTGCVAARPATLWTLAFAIMLIRRRAMRRTRGDGQ